MNKIIKTINSLSLQIKLWLYAAWSLPVTSIVALLLLDIFGWDTWYSQLLIVVTTVFIFVSSFWWWWIMFKVVDLNLTLNKTTDHFDFIKKELQEIKKEFP